MDDERLRRVIEMLVRKGNISDDVGGDLRATALDWLERARRELAVLDPILSAGQWRVAYTTAYDIYRHAAETVDLAAGYRIRASPGAHAATFALAAAVLDGRSVVFDASTASTFAGMRHQLEYLDVDSSSEVTEGDARWAAQVAERAINEVSSFLSEPNDAKT